MKKVEVDAIAKKLKLKDGDILIFHAQTNDIPPDWVEYISKGFSNVMPNVTLIFLPVWISLDHTTEEQLKKWGYFKKT